LNYSAMLRQLIANNTVADLAYAVLAAAAFILLLHMARRLVLHRLERVAEKTETVIDDFLVECCRPPASCWPQPLACTWAAIF